MVFACIKLDYNAIVDQFVREFNERLIRGKNPVLVFFDGKVTLLIHRTEQYLFFNLRINPFEPPFYKRILFAMVKKALKKKGYAGKPKLCSNKELSHLLEGYI